MGQGPGREQGQGLKKKTPHPESLTGTGQGIGAEAHRFHGPRGPVTNTSPSFLYPSLSAFVALVGCTLAAAVIH